MAYVPPHKRHSKDSPSPKPTPVPSSIIPQFNQTLTLGGGGRREQSNKPNPWRHHDRRSSSSNQGGGNIIWAEWGKAAGDLKRRGGREAEERPWVRIAERIVPDLVVCFRRAVAVKGLEPERDVVKLSIVARLGKVVFLRNYVGLASLRKAVNSELLPPCLLRPFPHLGLD